MNGELPVGRWERAIAARVSRRRYLPRAPDPSLLQRLEDHCARFRPLGAARALPVSPCPPNLFRGIVGSYGSIRGAPCCLAFVGPAGSEVQVGYVGEAAVLEATVLGLGTCWVGGLFRPDSLGDRVALGLGERVWAVAAVGLPVERKTLEERLMAGIARSHKRKPAEVLAPGIGSWPAWAARAVTAARLAPSALNRQPWRFRREGETLVLCADGPDTYAIPKRLDCGIALLHTELGARAAGWTGSWELLPAPGVAAFRHSSTP
ncbi:MAG: nitroreductase family protein [Thermodesulfobacteriota bacterium]